MTLPRSANIVVLASNYNPSIVSKEWLERKDVFKDTIDNFVHTPVFSLVENQNLALVVDEQRLQLAVKIVTEDNLANSKGIVTRLVGALPETPYKAVGLNYTYIFPEGKCNLGGLIKAQTTKLKAIFGANWQLGTTIVFSFEKFTVTVSVTPSLVKEQPVRVIFNFHSDVVNVDEVIARISSQPETVQKADSIVKELCNG